MSIHILPQALLLKGSLLLLELILVAVIQEILLLDSHEIGVLRYLLQDLKDLCSMLSLLLVYFLLFLDSFLLVSYQGFERGLVFWIVTADYPLFVILYFVERW